MAVVQSHLEAKRLVGKYGKDMSLNIARQRMLHALDMGNSLEGERSAYWISQAGFWGEVKKSIESVC